MNGLGLYSDLLDGCELLVCPGDLLQRLCELKLQLQQLEIQEEKDTRVLDDIQNVSNTLARVLVLWDTINGYYPDINKQQLDNIKSNITFSIQSHQSNLIDLRNEVNRLFKYPMEV